MSDVFNPDGTYSKTEWKTGDRISSNGLNKIETALDTINNKLASLKETINNQISEDLANLEGVINDQILENVSNLEKAISNLESRLFNVEKTLAELDNNTNEQILEDLDDLKKVVNDLDDTVGNLEKAIDDIETFIVLFNKNNKNNVITSLFKVSDTKDEVFFDSRMSIHKTKGCSPELFEIEMDYFDNVSISFLYTTTGVEPTYNPGTCFYVVLEDYLGRRMKKELINGDFMHKTLKVIDIFSYDGYTTYTLDGDLVGTFSGFEFINTNGFRDYDILLPNGDGVTIDASYATIGDNTIRIPDSGVMANWTNIAVTPFNKYSASIKDSYDDSWYRTTPATIPYGPIKFEIRNYDTDMFRTYSHYIKKIIVCLDTSKIENDKGMYIRDIIVNKC
jgi:predicted transcriptional regulator